MATELTYPAFFDAITSKKIVIVDFYATWCEPCQRFMKIIPRLEAALPENVGFAKVDIDAEKKLKEMYSVSKVPTFIFFYNGIEVFRQEGSIMTIIEITTKLQELLDK